MKIVRITSTCLQISAVPMFLGTLNVFTLSGRISPTESKAGFHMEYFSLVVPLDSRVRGIGNIIST